MTLQVSVVIPAYNEEAYLAATIESIRSAIAATPAVTQWELLVVDDDSTDGTVQVAESLGARVVGSGKRNIGGTRNVGAAAAQGEVLVFVDADTFISGHHIEKALEAIQKGAIGGGARIGWSGKVPFWFKPGCLVWDILSRIRKYPAGSFLFVKREDFLAVGGFDEQFYVAEEVALARKLQQRGKLVILRQKILSSPRKTEDFNFSDFVHLVLRGLRSPKGVWKDKDSLKIWYRHRENADATLSSEE